MDTFRIVLEKENNPDIRLVIEKGLHRLKRSIHANDSDAESDVESEPVSANKRRGKRSLGGQRTILKSMKATEIDSLARIRKYMSKNAQGVFLWVTLILTDLQDQAAAGMSSFASLEARLLSLPVELNGLYERIAQEIFASLSEEDARTSRAALMLVDGSGALGRPITIKELWEALAVPTDCEAALKSDFDPIMMSRATVGSWTGFRRQVRRKCGLFVEVVRYGQEDASPGCADDEVLPRDIVQFIHRTVKDFFENRRNPFGISFTEEEAVEEVKSIAARYCAIAFPKEDTKYKPSLQASPGSSWQMNVDNFVDYLDTRILLPFAVDVLARGGATSSHEQLPLGMDATVLDFLWCEDTNSIDEFLPELEYYPWCMTGLSDTNKTIHHALLGYAAYSAFSRGLATAAENLVIFFWDQNFDHRARYIILIVPFEFLL
jgi:hypothetical protein